MAKRQDLFRAPSGGRGAQPGGPGRGVQQGPAVLLAGPAKHLAAGQPGDGGRGRALGGSDPRAVIVPCGPKPGTPPLPIRTP
jgi:hypothetical protein